MPGKRSVVTAMGNASISLAHTGRMPFRTAASGKPPIPSKRLPIVNSCFSLLLTHLLIYFHSVGQDHLDPFGGDYFYGMYDLADHLLVPRSHVVVHLIHRTHCFMKPEICPAIGSEQGCQFFLLVLQFRYFCRQGAETA